MEVPCKTVCSKTAKITKIGENHFSAIASQDGGEGKFGLITPSRLICEPYGETSFTELIDEFAEKAFALKKTGVCGFLICGMETLWEARGAVLGCLKTSLPIYVVFKTGDDGITENDCPAVGAMITLQELGIAGFGISSDNRAEIIAELAAYAKVPLIAAKSGFTAEEIADACTAGATIFAGDFKDEDVPPETCITNAPIPEEQPEEILLAGEISAYFLTPDNIESSEPIECSVDMSDELLELSDTSLDVITVQVNTADDAYHFGLNAHMAALPVMFRSDSPIALKAALLCYHGRAMIDSNCEIDEDTLNEIAKKYGAVIY